MGLFRPKHYAVSCHQCEHLIPVQDIYALTMTCPRCKYAGTYEDIQVQQIDKITWPTRREWIALIVAALIAAAVLYWRTPFLPTLVEPR